MSLINRQGRKCVKSEQLQLQCEWQECTSVLNDLSDFYSHLDTHYKECYQTQEFRNEDGTYSCQWNECEFITNNPNSLLRHLYFHGYHTKVKWWGMLSIQKEKLGECRALHNRNIIPELPEGYNCEWADCMTVYDIPDQFYMHAYNHAVFAEEEIIEGSKRGFVCHWQGCDYKYETKNESRAKIGKFKLREHLRSHTKERCYACPWCGNMYVNRTKFIDHLNRQINIENHCFQCTHCSRTFATERLLKDHMRHHVNHYKCPKCAMTCPNPSGLKHHMRYKHSDERPFTCQYCPYKAKTSYDLQIHMTFHQSDLSYRCHVEGCDYAVRSLQNLRYHFRTKHMMYGKGKWYACHLCNKRFWVGFQLTHHLRKAHDFQWPPGHSRFKYKECDDGLFRLQTFRFESVELAEELMVHDQTSSEQAETSTKQAKKRPSKTKCSPARRKKLHTKYQTSSMTTRSASLLLQKAQNQRLNRSSARSRKGKALQKKRVSLLKTPPVTNESSSPESFDIIPLPQGLHVGYTPLPYTWGQRSFSSANVGYFLQHQFHAVNSVCRPDATRVDVVGDAPSVSTLPQSSNQADSCNPPSFTPLSNVRDSACRTEDAAPHSNKEVSSNNEQQSQLGSSVPATEKLAVVDGILASDEDGKPIAVMVNGEKYYLVQGKNRDQSKSLTYCLVSAAECETDDSSLPAASLPANTSAVSST